MLHRELNYFALYNTFVKLYAPPVIIATEGTRETENNLISKSILSVFG